MVESILQILKEKNIIRAFKHILFVKIKNK